VSDPTRDRTPAARYLRAGGEAVLLVLATLAAWPFAGADPVWEAAIGGAVALLAGLWAAHATVTRRARFKPDLVAGCLAGLVLLAVVQLVPLPLGLVKIISPARAEWHTAFTPDPLERLPDEPAAAVRPEFVPLSADPFATRTFAARVLAVFVVYAAARNWLVSKAAFRRLAWAALANGVALAVYALGQSASGGAKTVFGTIDVRGAFGPFVCRNHYPDYIALCAGLAVGLLFAPPEETKPEVDAGPPGGFWSELFDAVTAPLQLFDRPAAVAVALAVGLMLVSVAFSLSRGGMAAVAGAGVAAVLLARWKSTGGGVIGGTAVLAVAVAAAVLLWAGTEPIQKRFASTLSGQADDRLPLWSAAARSMPGVWPLGAGAGAFPRVEPLGRTDQSPTLLYDHAHNEFLEAIVEGGVIRLGLTLLLVGGVLVVVAHGYRKLRARSSGGLLLGAWFGLAALVLHAGVDFGIHMPAVAVLAAAVAGYAVAVSNDPEFTPVKRRISRDDPPPPPSEKPTGGGQTIAFVVLLAAVAVLVALDARSRSRADWLRIDADRARRSDAPDRLDRALAYQQQRTRVTPGDPIAWLDLARAHIDAAYPSLDDDDELPDDVVQAHIRPALRALRTARELCPLVPEVHARLALYARYFATADPPRVYAERAKRLLPSDPVIRYACGLEAAREHDWAAAAADWKRAIELNPNTLPAILSAARDFPPDRLREQLLPDDPVVMVNAANTLFPDHGANADGRRPFLLQALAAADRSDLTDKQAVAVGKAGDELDRPDPVTRMWAALVLARPKDPEVRKAAADWYERQELYDRLVPELNWLRENVPGERGLTDRLRAAEHGLRLQEILKKNDQ
jgi:tetratricopeptide (TPR) repeat protein